MVILKSDLKWVLWGGLFMKVMRWRRICYVLKFECLFFVMCDVFFNIFCRWMLLWMVLIWWIGIFWSVFGMVDRVLLFKVIGLCLIGDWFFGYWSMMFLLSVNVVRVGYWENIFCFELVSIVSFDLVLVIEVGLFGFNVWNIDSMGIVILIVVVSVLCVLNLVLKDLLLMLLIKVKVFL